MSEKISFTVARVGLWALAILSTRQLFFIGILCSSVILVYLPTFLFGFLRWDDNINIYNNLMLTRGQWDRFWSEPFFGLYIPVSYTLWGWLYSVGDGDAVAFRIFNFSLHLGNTFLVGCLLKSWLRETEVFKGTLWILGVVIFALHPLQVEAVAWISGGRDLLSAFFALGALYLVNQKFNWQTLVPAWLLFILALFSKPGVATLPILFFFLPSTDIKVKKRINIFAAVVWFLPIVFSLVISSSIQSKVFNSSALYLRPWIAADSIGFYLLKFFLPVNLMADYGRTVPFLIESVPLDSLLFLIFVALGFYYLSGTIYWLKVWRPWMAWAVALLPVTGIIPFAFQEYSTVADRYTYFAMLYSSWGVCVLVAALPFSKRGVFEATVGVIAITLLFLSASRVYVWRDNQTFFADMLRGNQKSYSAWMGLGSVASDRGDEEEAEGYYRQAEQLRPGDLAATDALLMSLTRLEKFDSVAEFEEKILSPQFGRLLQQYPRNTSNILTSLGLAHRYRGNKHTAAEYFCLAATVNPYNTNYQKNALLGLLAVQAQVGSHFCGEPLDFDRFLTQRSIAPN